MSVRRHNSHARSVAASRDVSAVRIVSDGPTVEGEHEVRYSLRLRCYRALYNYGGGTVSGFGDTEDEAVEKAKSNAAELLERRRRAAGQVVGQEG